MTSAVISMPVDLTWPRPETRTGRMLAMRLPVKGEPFKDFDLTLPFIAERTSSRASKYSERRCKPKMFPRKA
jgi:hypothetical protein